MRVIEAGSVVRILRPRKLRGVLGTVQRRVSGGYEVEIRSELGTPLHLVAPSRHLAAARAPR